MNNRVAIYIRVSTDMQIDKDSLPMQRRDLIAYAQLILNTDDYEVFEDAGYSGKNTLRPAFQEMMTKVRSGLFTHILVWKIDRISRNLLDFSQMYTELKKLGVTFVSKNEQFDTSTAMGEAMLKIILVFAELERNMTSERVIATMVSKATQGEWNGGHVPIGYKYDVESKTFSIDKDEAATVHAIFDKYEELKSITLLVSWLKDNGYRSKLGKVFSATTIHVILRNEFYLGTYIYNRFKDGSRLRRKDESELVRFENHHPAIISQQQFDRVAKIRAANQRGNRTHDTKHIHVFGRHIICGKCGRMLGATSAAITRDKWIHSNYVCYNAQPHINTCDNMTVSDAVVGEYFINLVLNLLHAHQNQRFISSPADLQGYLLSGHVFSNIDHIEYDDLVEAFNVITSVGTKDIFGRFKKKHSNLRRVRSQSSILKMQITNNERALERLKNIYLFDPQGMPPEEYKQKRMEIEERIAKFRSDLEKSIASTGEIDDADFVTQASRFILEQEMSGKRYIYYKALAKSLDPSLLRDFVDTILDTITIADGVMTGIAFRNGIQIRFIPKKNAKRVPDQRVRKKS